MTVGRDDRLDNQIYLEFSPALTLDADQQTIKMWSSLPNSSAQQEQAGLEGFDWSHLVKKRFASVGLRWKTWATLSVQGIQSARHTPALEKTKKPVILKFHLLHPGLLSEAAAAVAGCALTCCWPAAFMGVLEEEMHQSTVTWILCSGVQKSQQTLGVNISKGKCEVMNLMCWLDKSIPTGTSILSSGSSTPQVVVAEDILAHEHEVQELSILPPRMLSLP
ncbi:PREDICTED: uncharacterized protein LOC108497751 [Lepidothrix coronata]|uniref:Uncharacterized protein LOC108497751 n=1 Tax=Lepidothrix coronata TaxID=321398 RepID=A0A6J0HAU3_9PASS|nr:PREDICTED: uncharacterized protein LOC108497751 [Lepidothrix coronata]